MGRPSDAAPLVQKGRCLLPIQRAASAPCPASYCAIRRLSGSNTNFLKLRMTASPVATAASKRTVNLPDLPKAPSSTPSAPSAVHTCSSGTTTPGDLRQAILGQASKYPRSYTNAWTAEPCEALQQGRAICSLVSPVSDACGNPAILRTGCEVASAPRSEQEPGNLLPYPPPKQRT